MAQTLIRHYGERLHTLLDAGKARGELHADLDPEAAATLFIGTVQGLVMQSMLADDVTRIRSDAPGVFAIYLRGVGASRSEEHTSELQSLMRNSYADFCL